MPDEFMSAGVLFFNFGWRDMKVPPLPLLFNLVKVMEFTLSGGHAIAVHCHAGFGRTGVAIACLLVFARKMTPQEAIEMVRSHRPGSIQTKGQVKVVSQFAKELARTRAVFASSERRFSLSTALSRQREVLHGLELEARLHVPKLVHLVCARLMRSALVEPELVAGAILCAVWGDEQERLLSRVKAKVNDGHWEALPSERESLVLAQLLLDWMEHLAQPIVTPQAARGALGRRVSRRSSRDVTAADMGSARGVRATDAAAVGGAGSPKADTTEAGGHHAPTRPERDPPLRIRSGSTGSRRARLEHGRASPDHSETSPVAAAAWDPFVGLPGSTVRTVHLIVRMILELQGLPPLLYRAVCARVSVALLHLPHTNAESRADGAAQPAGAFHGSRQYQFGDLFLNPMESVHEAVYNSDNDDDSEDAPDAGALTAAAVSGTMDSVLEAPPLDAPEPVHFVEVLCNEWSPKLPVPVMADEPHLHDSSRGASLARTASDKPRSSREASRAAQLPRSQSVSTSGAHQSESGGEAREGSRRGMSQSPLARLLPALSSPPASPSQQASPGGDPSGLSPAVLGSPPAGRREPNDPEARVLQLFAGLSTERQAALLAQLFDEHSRSHAQAAERRASEADAEAAAPPTLGGPDAAHPSGSAARLPVQRARALHTPVKIDPDFDADASSATSSNVPTPTEPTSHDSLGKASLAEGGGGSGTGAARGAGATGGASERPATPPGNRITGGAVGQAVADLDGSDDGSGEFFVTVTRPMPVKDDPREIGAAPHTSAGDTGGRSQAARGGDDRRSSLQLSQSAAAAPTGHRGSDETASGDGASGFHATRTQSSIA